MFQFPSLLSDLTAFDNVALPTLLGRTTAAEQAFARAGDLLARVGLTDRAGHYPGSMSGGEQRRVAIARALINSPPLLLANKPTSDLGEDTETDIIDLLVELQRVQAFGFVLVTHNLELAKRAERSYEMRQGAFAAIDLPSSAPPARSRRFATAAARPAPAPPAAVQAPVRLGSGPVAGAADLPRLDCVLATNFRVERYQAAQMRERAVRIAALQYLALSGLRGDIRSLADLGDTKYELITYLENVADQPIYVMAPDMHAYVQVGSSWQEVPLTPIEDSANGVQKIEGTRVYRYQFDARVRDFAQLIPNYMHVRFSSTMLVSFNSEPNHDVFERKDNYYFYLKPSDGRGRRQTDAILGRCAGVDPHAAALATFRRKNWAALDLGAESAGWSKIATPDGFELTVRSGRTRGKFLYRWSANIRTFRMHSSTSCATSARKTPRNTLRIVGLQRLAIRAAARWSSG